MPCGVETTKRIVELLRAMERPMTVTEISKSLGIQRSLARHGVDNLLDLGVPPLLTTELRIPGRQGRPERAYSLLLTD